MVLKEVWVKWKSWKWLGMGGCLWAMAAVCTASDNDGLETCALCGRVGNVLKNDKTVLNASVPNYLEKKFNV